MKPLYKIPSGKFAGWKDERNNRLYDRNGNNVGYFKGDVAFSLNGSNIGEITREDYIGKRIGKTYPIQGSVVPYVGVALVPYVGRVGLAIGGWEDPDF